MSDLFLFNDTLDSISFSTSGKIKQNVDTLKVPVKSENHSITFDDSIFLSDSFTLSTKQTLEDDSRETTKHATKDVSELPHRLGDYTQVQCSTVVELNGIEKKSKLSDWNLPELILSKYASRNVTEMFEWQYECLDNEGLLENNRNLVYSAPTSAGKTLVSEILAIKTLLERNKKDILSTSGIRVEGFMGSYNPPGGFQAVQMAICTIEKANSLVNRLLEENILSDIGAIIVDEMHLLGDPSRGYLLELLLTKVKFMCLRNEEVKIQIIGMSATLPNLNVLAEWLNAVLYMTNFRPIPLLEQCHVGGEIYDNQMNFVRKLSPSTELQTDTDNILQLCLETIENSCSVLIFCPTKNWCENLAQQIAVAIWKLGTTTGTYGECLRNQLDTESISEVLEQLKRTPVGLDKGLCKTISFGVAFHHAGLTMDERDIVEGAFRSGAIRILIATSTLSSGVNLPARRVIIRTPLFHGKPIDILTYKQMIGRAGRMGKDTLGESLLICQRNDYKLARELMSGKLEPIESCLSSSGKLKRAILEVIASNVVITPEDLHLFTSCTLYAQESNDNSLEDPMEESLQFLINNQFIRLQTLEDNSQRYIATSLAKACLSSSMPPEEGLALFTELEKARQCFVLESELHLVYLVTPYSACNQWGNIDWMFFLELWEKLPGSMKRVGDLVGIKDFFLVNASRGKIPNSSMNHNLQIHKRFYVALALQDLVNEVPLNEVASKFNCSRGTLQSLQQSAATFAGMVTSFSKQLGWSTVEILISQFQDRLHFGVNRDLLDLMRLPILNGPRARALYNSGMETLAQLAGAPLDGVENALRKMTPFESEKERIGETKFEADRRRKVRTVWVTGKQGLTEREAAEMLIMDARRYLELEMGLSGAKWDKDDGENSVLSGDSKENFVDVMENSVCSKDSRRGNEGHCQSNGNSVDGEGMANNFGVSGGNAGHCQSDSNTVNDKHRTNNFSVDGDREKYRGNDGQGSSGENRVDGVGIVNNLGMYGRGNCRDNKGHPQSDDKGVANNSGVYGDTGNYPCNDSKTNSGESRVDNEGVTNHFHVCGEGNCHGNSGDNISRQGDGNGGGNPVDNEGVANNLGNQSRISCNSDIFDVSNISVDLSDFTENNQTGSNTTKVNSVETNRTSRNDLIGGSSLNFDSSPQATFDFANGISNEILSLQPTALSNFKRDSPKSLNSSNILLLDRSQNSSPPATTTPQSPKHIENDNQLQHYFASPLISPHLSKPFEHSDPPNICSSNLIASPHPSTSIEDKTQPPSTLTSLKFNWSNDSLFENSFESSINMKPTSPKNKQPNFLLPLLDGDTFLEDAFASDFTNFNRSKSIENSTPTSNISSECICSSQGLSEMLETPLKRITSNRLSVSRRTPSTNISNEQHSSQDLSEMLDTPSKRITSNRLSVSGRKRSRLNQDRNSNSDASCLDETPVKRKRVVMRRIKLKRKSRRGIDSTFIISQKSDASAVNYPLDQEIPPADLTNIQIIDVCGDDKLFKCFCTELARQKEISLSLGCIKAEVAPTPKIGAKISKSTDQVEGKNSELICDDRHVNGVSISWGGNTAYYLDFHNNETIALNLKLVSLKNILTRADLKLKIFETKQHVKILKKFLKVELGASLEDPKVIDWLLDPEGREKNLQAMTLRYSPEAVKLSQLAGSCKGVGSIGLDLNSSITPRIRSAVEAVSVWHILESALNEITTQDRKLLHTLHIEMETISILSEMELNGICLDRSQLQELSETLSGFCSILETKAYKLAGRNFSFTSPTEVARVLGMYRGRRVSTNKQALEQTDNPIAPLIIQWRKINCTLTKMIYPFLKMVRNNRIYGTSITFSATGRISMHEPNLQNVPRDFVFLNPNNGEFTLINCRDVFRADDGYELVSADYCQLELRLLAHLSKDPTLCAVMRSKEDVFRSIAAKLNNIEDMEVTDQLRQRAKQICYGIIYGMGVKTLSEQLNSTEEEAATFLNDFHAKYPAINQYIKQVITDCKEEGYVVTIGGRRRYFPNINKQHPPSRNQAERQAVNTTIQGSAADVAKNAMVLIEKQIGTRFEGSIHKPKLILQLHDEFLYETPRKYAGTLAKILKKHMEGSVDLDVPFPVKIKRGKSWGSLEEVVLT